MLYVSHSLVQVVTHAPRAKSCGFNEGVFREVRGVHEAVVLHSFQNHLSHGDILLLRVLLLRLLVVIRTFVSLLSPAAASLFFATGFFDFAEVSLEFKAAFFLFCLLQSMEYAEGVFLRRQTQANVERCLTLYVWQDRHFKFTAA